MSPSGGESNSGPTPNGGVPPAEQDARVPNGDGGGEVVGDYETSKKGGDTGVATIEIEGGGGGDGGGKDTLEGLLRQFVSGVLRPGDQPIAWRIRASYGEAAPRIREASLNSASEVLAWVRAGSPFRALLVTAVGTVALLALTGLMVFMVFFLVATVNAVILSLLMSLAAAGAMLAIFFASLAVVYVGALSVAVFVISGITISAIIAVFAATGWVGFFWVLWIAARKSADLTKQSLSITSSAISAYSGSRNVHHED